MVIILHVFYQDFPYGYSEAFAEDELKILANGNNIKIYCFAENTEVKRNVPETCEVINLYNFAYLKKAKMVSFFKMLAPKTFKEILFMKKSGYKVNAQNVHRILSYYKFLYISKKHKFDISSGDILYSYWCTEVGYLTSRLKKDGVKTVSRAHGYDMYHERGYNPFRREVFSSLDCLYCINSSGREDIIKYNKDYISPENVKVAHLGVDFKECAPKTYEEKDTLKIATCSSIIPLKRLDILIGALSKLDIKTEWIHFGGGSMSDQIKALAEKELENKTNISYTFAGTTEHGKLLELLKTDGFDLFVNCSDFEGIPVSVMEAMEFGIPCIARNVGGMSELICKDNGYLLDKNAGDNEFAKAISDFYSLSQADKCRLSENSIYKIKSEFNSTLNYSEFKSELLK